MRHFRNRPHVEDLADIADADAKRLAAKSTKASLPSNILQRVYNISDLLGIRADFVTDLSTTGLGQISQAATTGAQPSRRCLVGVVRGARSKRSLCPTAGMRPSNAQMVPSSAGWPRRGRLRWARRGRFVPASGSMRK